MINNKIDHIRHLLLEIELDYIPEVQEARNFEYAYRLCLAFAKYIARDDGKIWGDLGNSSRSSYMYQARDMAGIDHDTFLIHVRDGKYDVEHLFDDPVAESLGLWVAKTVTVLHGIHFSPEGAKERLQHLYPLIDPTEWEQDELGDWQTYISYGEGFAYVEKRTVAK